MRDIWPRVRQVLRVAVSSIWMRVIVAVGIIWFLVYFSRIDFELLASLSGEWPALLAAFLLTLPPFLIVSYRFKLVLSSQGIRVPLSLALRWTMIGSFFDLFTPSSNGGDVVKAGYVAAHVGAGLRTCAVMAVGFDRVIGLLGLFLLATIAGVFGWRLLADLPGRGLIVGMTFVLGVGPLIVFRLPASRSVHGRTRVNGWLAGFRWGPRLTLLIGTFNALSERPTSLLAALVLSVLNHVFWCTSLLFIATAAGSAVSVVEGFSVFPLAIFAGIFGVSGGFGAGTAAFDVLLSHVLLVQNGALIGLLFQTFGLLSRLCGLPFYVASTKSASRAPSGRLPLPETGVGFGSED